MNQRNNTESAILTVKAFEKNLFGSVSVPPINLQNVDTVFYLMSFFPTLASTSSAKTVSSTKK